ncbi:MAG: NAD(P)/FAD-dependent oxidoreductase, partial [Pyrinomonadaceae bacterium]|nr:NAD(P)/FAD-dependent oxidoreductase [Pyrinomonadaceae bacterium]
ISGGGRCNFTNLDTSPANFLSANPNFCKSALARYTPVDFIALVEKHGIKYHEKKLGQMFCDGSSREIIEMLLAECGATRVEIRLHCAVREVRRPDCFLVSTNQGDFTSAVLVVATGGLSIPPLGATDFGYRLARQFGLKVLPTRPALVPLTLRLAELKLLKELSGVSLDALASCGGAEFRENILFTHRGLSGPAVLQVSSYWRSGEVVTLNLLPDDDALSLLTEARESRQELKTLLARHVPRRFAQAWCELNKVPSSLHRLTPSELEQLAARLHRWQLPPEGTEGYKKAEVTAGGVETGELSSKTMEARRVPGLYFIGEVVDVTGHLGGFNFQWAWASGFAAGQFA